MITFICSSGDIPPSGLGFTCQENNRAGFSATPNFCSINNPVCLLPSGLIITVSGDYDNPIGKGPFTLRNILYSENIKVWQSDAISGVNNFNFDYTPNPTQHSVDYWAYYTGIQTTRDLYYGINNDGQTLLSPAWTQPYFPDPMICYTQCNELPNIVINGNVVSPGPIPTQFVSDCISGIPLELGNSQFTGRFTLSIISLANNSVYCGWGGFLKFDVINTVWDSGVSGGVLFNNPVFLMNYTTISGTPTVNASGYTIGVANNGVQTLIVGNLMNFMGTYNETYYAQQNYFPTDITAAPSGVNWTLKTL